MSTKSPIVQGAVFFAIFFVATFAVEAALFVAMEALFNTRLIPRGLGWIVMPFSAGFAGWAFGQQVGIEGVFKVSGVKLQDLLNATRFRAWAAGSALWTVIILGVFLIFDPFDRYRIRYWTEEDWFKCFAIIVGPSMIGLLGIGLFNWAMNTNNKATTSKIAPSQQRYIPSEQALRNILWTLTALSVVDGNISENKLDCVAEIYLQVRGSQLDRGAITQMAQTFLRDGPDRAKDLLVRNRSQMQMNDREMLIKFCCLLVSLNKPISEKERALIYGIADTLEVPRARLHQL